MPTLIAESKKQNKGDQRNAFAGAPDDSSKTQSANIHSSR